MTELQGYSLKSKVCACKFDQTVHMSSSPRYASTLFDTTCLLVLILI